MVLKCSTVCLVALGLLGSFCQAQNFGQKPSPPQKNPPFPQQEKQTFEKPITWRYPDGPTPEVVPEGPHEQRNPVPAATVAVECRERQAHVEVKKDLFAINYPINPAHLTLGGCAVSSEDTMAQVLIFDVELHECGSQLSMSEEALIYTFTLNYNPQPMSHSSVLRTNQAAVIVQCHYPRKHNVSSLALEPVWVPYASTKMAEEFLYFSLTLMSENFAYARPSFQFYLGELIYLEAKVHQYYHVPLRVFVDNCVATISPEVSSSPSYDLIYKGCMVDARLTNSRSMFISRNNDEDKLRFQFEAFKFQESNSGMIYITCLLRAAPVSTGFDNEHRACSYSNGWTEASDYHQACASCESSGFPVPMNPGGGGGGTGTGSGTTGSTGGMGSTIWGTSSNPSGKQVRKMREAAKTEVFEWQGEVRLGPFQIEDKVIA